MNNIVEAINDKHSDCYAL